MSLTIHTERTNTVRVLCCSGRISYGRDIEALTNLITELLNQHKIVLLDLEGVTAIDSAGVGALVVLYCWAQGSQGRIAFCCPSRRVSDLLELFKLQDLLQIHETREGAISVLLAS